MNNPSHCPRFRFGRVIHYPLETVFLFTVSPIFVVGLSLDQPLVPNSHAPLPHGPALHALSLRISEQPKAPTRHTRNHWNSIDRPENFQWGFILRD